MVPLYKKHDGTSIYEFEKRTALRGIQSEDLFIASCVLVALGLTSIFGYSPYNFPVPVACLMLLYPAKRLQKKEVKAASSKELLMSPVDIDEGYIESNRERRHCCQPAVTYPFDTFVFMSQRYFRSRQFAQFFAAAAENIRSVRQAPSGHIARGY